MNFPLVRREYFACASLADAQLSLAPVKTDDAALTIVLAGTRLPREPATSPRQMLHTAIIYRACARRIVVSAYYGLGNVIYDKLGAMSRRTLRGGPMGNAWHGWLR
jgi:hypothetical protein